MVNKTNFKERIESIEEEIEQLSISHRIMMDQFNKEFKRNKLELIGIWVVATASLTSIFLWLLVILEVL